MIKSTNIGEGKMVDIPENLKKAIKDWRKAIGEKLGLHADDKGEGKKSSQHAGLEDSKASSKHRKEDREESVSVSEDSTKDTKLNTYKEQSGAKPESTPPTKATTGMSR
jgi:hypothetical protein